MGEARTTTLWSTPSGQRDVDAEVELGERGRRAGWGPGSGPGAPRRCRRRRRSRTVQRLADAVRRSGGPTVGSPRSRRRQHGEAATPSRSRRAPRSGDDQMTASVAVVVDPGDRRQPRCRRDRRPRTARRRGRRRASRRARSDRTRAFEPPVAEAARRDHRPQISAMRSRPLAGALVRPPGGQRAGDQARTGRPAGAAGCARPAGPVSGQSAGSAITTAVL